MTLSVRMLAAMQYSAKGAMHGMRVRHAAVSPENVHHSRRPAKEVPARRDTRRREGTRQENTVFSDGYGRNRVVPSAGNKVMPQWRWQRECGRLAEPVQRQKCLRYAPWQKVAMPQMEGVLQSARAQTAHTQRTKSVKGVYGKVNVGKLCVKGWGTCRRVCKGGEGNNNRVCRQSAVKPHACVGNKGKGVCGSVCVCVNRAMCPKSNP